MKPKQTRTQEAADLHSRAYRDTRDTMCRIAMEEFPVGTPVQWQLIHGKPMTKGVVAEVGPVGQSMLTTWRIRTASGIEHRVDCDRLYPQEPQA